VFSRQVVITGGNAGLGFEAARQLVGMGAHVVLACRDAAKAQAAAQALVATTVTWPPHHLSALATLQSAGRTTQIDPASLVEVASLDLESPASVAAFCRAFEGRPIHVLV
jgi:WW domain-containing oxidoreductase